MASLRNWFDYFAQSVFFKKLIARLFPEFSNKLTWFVTATGITLAAAPVLPHLLLNIGVKIWNENFGYWLTVPSVPEVSPWLGVVIICMGLVHNLAYKYTADLSVAQSKAKSNSHDLSLKAAFLQEIPTESQLIHLLKDHDFGGSFPSAPISYMDRFVLRWRGAEFQFHTQDLQDASVAFRDSLSRLSLEIARSCGPARADNYLTALSGAADDFNCPEHVREAIKQLNGLATDAFEKHQHLVKMLTRLQ